MNVRYVVVGMIFIFVGVMGLLYFHGMAIVQPAQTPLDAHAKELILLGLYMGMACLVLGAIGGALLGYAAYLDAAEPPETRLTKSAIKFCRHCGAENKDDAVFCEKCGKKLE